MEAAQLALFANPIAGRGRGLQIAGRLCERLSREGWGVRSFFGRPESREAGQVLRGARISATIVIGGDGTLRAVAEQVLAGWASAEEPVPPLLVVPVGTANLMGQHLGVRWDEEHLEDEVVAALLGRRVVQLDAARADERLLLLVAGVGFDAAIVHEVARRRKGPITKGSYIGPALAALWEMRDVPFLNVVVDGREIAREVPGMVFVGNIPQYGTGFAVLPEARPDDGVLDVCVMPCRSRGELVSLFLHAAAGEHLQMEGVKYVKGRQVSIESARPVPVQIDGEAAGFTPLKIELLPVRLPFIVPGGNP